MVTIVIHKVEETLRKGSDGDEWKKLEHFREELEDRRTELKRLDEEILDTLLDGAEDEEINKETDETNEYREKIGCTILAIKEAVQKPSLENWSRSNSVESLMSTTSSNGGVKKAQVKLPKFNLRSFSGKVHEWQEFLEVVYTLRELGHLLPRTANHTPSGAHFAHYRSLMLVIC